MLKNKLKKSILIQRIYYKLKYLYNKFKYGQNIGKKTYIDKSVHILGLKNITIGSNTIISDDTWLNVNERNENIDIEIGSNCYIGKRNFFSSGKKIIIKDFFMSGINCSFLGAGHVVNTPLNPYIFAGTTNKDIIYICTNVWLATNVTVIGNVTIGHGSIIGANSIVLSDIPPFSIAVGNPAKVIKRFDFKNNKWTKEFKDLDSFISEKEYEKKLKQYDGSPLPLLASGKNFGDLY